MMMGSTVVSDNTELYRHFDINGSLLYIGISTSTMVRLASGHKGYSAWYYDIVAVTIEHFKTREKATMAEKAAIIAEEPIHNKVWSKEHNYPPRKLKTPIPFRKPTRNTVPIDVRLHPGIWTDEHVIQHTSLTKEERSIWSSIYTFPKRCIGRCWLKKSVEDWAKHARTNFNKYHAAYEESFNDPRDN
jgi:hypothetical protein